MGFLSGLTGALTGGGGGGGGGGTSQAGFSLLPPQIQNTFTHYADNLNNLIPTAASAYTPMPQTADETQAFNRIRQGFAPTQQSLTQDVGMLMNPYDQFVTDDINRQAQGQYSILKQDMNAAGQLGSNRQQLGANDIEQTRLGTIGKLRQDQYNQSLGQIFNSLIPARQADAQGLLGIGNFQRNLDTQTRTAPITGAQQIGSALGVLPSNGGSTQTTNGTNAQNNNGFGPILQGIGTALQVPGVAEMFGLSDRNLKENIEPLGYENGVPIYEFSYIWSPDRYIGVMAQDIQDINPDAVREIGGYLAVNYVEIGVEMRRA